MNGSYPQTNGLLAKVVAEAVMVTTKSALLPVHYYMLSAADKIALLK